MTHEDLEFEARHIEPCDVRDYFRYMQEAAFFEAAPCILCKSTRLIFFANIIENADERSVNEMGKTDITETDIDNIIASNEQSESFGALFANLITTNDYALGDLGRDVLTIYKKGGDLEDLIIALTGYRLKTLIYLIKKQEAERVFDRESEEPIHCEKS